jgi:F0F1-type ATP synthase membrane subunit c/vacuolar-type H+-ATPase subunit K
MEPMDSGLVLELRKHLVLTRVLGFSLCFLAPAIYLLLLVQMVFHGDPHPLVAGFHSVPWGDLRIIVLSMASLALLAAGPFLVQQFWARADAAGTAADLFASLRTGHIVHCALMESVAIFGLVLGFTVGSAAGPVCLMMLLVPPVGYLLLVPGARSRMRLLSLRASRFPGGRVPGPSSISPGDDLGAP